jgi:peroxiredoxin
MNFLYPFLFLLPVGEPTPDHADVWPGHSYHGEVFNEGPRQKAYLMGGTGKVRFPVSTRSAEAHAFFEQGVGQLHGFWYFEAERSFRHVALLDPNCAMAYWGMAMANWESEKRAAGFIKKARDLIPNTTRREQLYIEAMADYVLGSNKGKRQQLHLDTLKRIFTDYPDDIEAKAFHVVRSWQFKAGQNTPALDRMLDEVFKVNPMHPAHHYRIHLWDNTNASNALTSAALCGASAPGIAHMWHMPGHTYDKLKRYSEAAWQQEASSRADHAHMIHDRILPDQIHNYAHNQEWLIRNLSHIGRVNDAVALAKNLIELPRHPKYNLPSKKKATSSFGRTRLIEVLERYELWDEVLELADTMYLEPTDSADEQAKRLRLIGLAHAGKEDSDKLAETIAALQKLSGKDQGALKELTMLQAVLKEDAKSALDQVKSLKNVSQSRQARYYLLAGDKAKAEQLARQAADSTKNQIAPLAVYVEMLHENGKMKECSEAFDRLRKMSGTIDSLASPVFKRLEPIAKELDLPADWRIPAKFPKDFGERPPLDGIGPLKWQPTPSPRWSLPDAQGKLVSEKEIAGKPTVMIFYLGYGCAHCAEQLRKFAAEQKSFADAGISLIGVSTDSREALRRALSGEAAKTVTFPVVSDPKCDVFKLFRAYDDFEDQPLHGLFLLDGRGLVRWHDIGYEPFVDTPFLLKEAKRLLALPG